MLLLWILLALKSKKSIVKHPSCQCTELEDYAIRKDRLNNQIPDGSTLKAMSVEINLSGPRETALPHRFCVASDLQGDLRDNCRNSAVVRDTQPFLT